MVFYAGRDWIAESLNIMAGWMKILSFAFVDWKEKMLAKTFV